MELPVNPSQLIDLLRAWFFAKDRSVVLAASTFVEGANITTPDTPVINRGRLYWKDKCWYQLDEDGVEVSLCNGVWADWTPTVDQGGAVAATVSFARYIVLARTVIMNVRLGITGTGVAANDIIINNVPTAIQPALAPFGLAVIGAGGVRDDSTNITYTGVLVADGINAWKFRHDGDTLFIGRTPSFALANQDAIGFHATYER
jgi:hypothetical protein